MMLSIAIFWLSLLVLLYFSVSTALTMHITYRSSLWNLIGIIRIHYGVILLVALMTIFLLGIYQQILPFAQESTTTLETDQLLEGEMGLFVLVVVTLALLVSLSISFFTALVALTVIYGRGVDAHLPRKSILRLVLGYVIGFVAILLGEIFIDGNWYNASVELAVSLFNLVLLVLTFRYYRAEKRSEKLLVLQFRFLVGIAVGEVALLIINLFVSDDSESYSLTTLLGPSLLCLSWAILDIPLLRVRSHLPWFEQLTPREQEVLELTQQGLVAKEISAQLTIAPRTVETHLLRIYRKAGVGSKQELLSLVRGM